MRSWMGAISALGSVVMTQQLSNHSLPGSGRQASKRPAKANIDAPESVCRASLGVMYQGCLGCLPGPVTCHS